jgi:glycosyltransferase involved in cell wall biosynthesis
MNSIELSAVVIALDEERNLPGLLHSLDWVDEVVVVDGGSRDRTVEIAQSAGAVTEVRKFDNYAAQRNFASQLARGRWILSIDADERPSPGFGREVWRRVGSREAAAWRVPIRSQIFGRTFRYSGTQNDRPVRLFDRDKARWVGAVHERLLVEGQIGAFDSHLEHETIPNLAAFLAKMHRYTSLDAAAGELRRPPVHQPWTAPAREVARRLLVKHGWLDGPEGWAFCLLSGLSAWVEVDKRRRMWRQKGRIAQG